MRIVLDKKADTPEDKLKKYLLNKSNGDIITRTDLRNEKFVKETMFKGWIDEAMPAMIEELKFVYEYTGEETKKGWQVKR